MEYFYPLIFLLAFSGAVLSFVFHERLPPVFNWLGLFFLFTGVSQLIAVIIIPYTGNNILVYNISMIVNFGLIATILYRLFKTRTFKTVLLILFGVVGLLFLYLVWADMPDRFASRALTVLNLSVIASCLFFYYEMLIAPELQSITRQGKFWIAAAFLVYHVSSFVKWLVFEISNYANELKLLNSINAVFIILLYLTLILAIFVQIKNQPHDQYQ